MHVYEVQPRKEERGVDLISDALPFGRLRHGRCEPLLLNLVEQIKRWKGPSA